MQLALEHCHFPELIGEPLRLELCFSLPLQNVREFIVLSERMPSVAIDKFSVVGKYFEMDNTSLNQIITRTPLLKYRYMRSFSSDFVPNVPNDTFAVIKTQASNTPGEHWILIANVHHEFYFSDSLGLSIKSYPFRK